MICPKCEGATYDNTEKVATGWRGPLFKCKDESCGWVKWPPKGAKAAAAKGAKLTWGEHARVYERSLLLGEKYVTEAAKRLKLTATIADVLSATATIYIGVSRAGVAEPAPKPAAAEPLDQRPAALVPDADDDDLPF
jgi:hypothetical protein